MDGEIAGFYAELSRYELLDLFYTVNGNVTDNLTVLITTLFSYLALAYIAGKKLSRFQVAAITVIYSSFVLFMIGGISRDFGIASGIAFAVFEVSTGNDVIILSGVLVAGWLLSIVFMLQVRRPGA